MSGAQSKVTPPWNDLLYRKKTATKSKHGKHLLKDEMGNAIEENKNQFVFQAHQII
jgi:hypothetical protein